MAPRPTTVRRGRPLKQQDPDHIPDTIFEALGQDEDGRPKGQPKTDTGPSVAELMKQLGDQQRRIDEMERTNLALSMPVKADVAILPKEPVINFTGLPDPIVNAQAYAEEMAKRMQAYNAELAAFHTAKQAAQPQPVNYDVLWEDFTATYTDYADDPEGIEFATSKVMKNMQRRGVDPQRYMIQNSDKFFRDVVAAYDERFGKPGEDVEPEPAKRGRPSTRDEGRRPEEDAEANRTGGIFGGVDGSSSGRTPRAPPPGDMIKDLQDMQRKTGYY
jgi:hypothetical protein